MAEAVILTVDSVRTRASTNEALVTFAVPLEEAALVSSFMTRIGQQVGAAFAEVDQKLPPKAPETPKKRPYGMQAQALMLSGFFRAPEVWEALGTDEEFRAWVQRQPSAWSAEFSEYLDNGEGRCVAAHVSRIEYGRGHSHKPEYACIPLTDAEHKLQHAQGESAFSRYREDGTVESGREWFERMRIKYVQEWAWDTLKAKLGYSSMGDVPPEKIRAWAREFNVEHLLPKEYRE